jgi:uncharacterized protein YkwD
MDHHVMHFSKKRFQPGMDALDPRALLSGVSASLSHGVLTISRKDVARVIQVDVQPLSIRSHARAAMPGGMVVVQGVGRFPARRVHSIAINPGPSAANVIVHESPGKAIPVRINAPISSNLASASLPGTPASATSDVAIPGVTGIQSSLEQQVFDLINVERINAGLPPLRANAKLITAAQIHGRDMASQGVMEHDLSGVAQPSLVSRAQFVGYSYGWLGENIASNFSDAASVVAAWMASPGHRANILNANLTEAGIGIGRDSNGVLYFCQEFGSPAN